MQNRLSYFKNVNIFIKLSDIVIGTSFRVLLCFYNRILYFITNLLFRIWKTIPLVVSGMLYVPMSFRSYLFGTGKVIPFYLFNGKAFQSGMPYRKTRSEDTLLLNYKFPSITLNKRKRVRPGLAEWRTKLKSSAILVLAFPNSFE